MATELTVSDLTRPLADVTHGLPEWRRGDRDEAIAITLDLSARNAHTRGHTVWVWGAVDAVGAPVWLIPVRVADAERFAPRGPMAVLTRCVRAAADAGAAPHEIRLFDWDGFVGLAAPGADRLLTPVALAEAHPDPARVAFQPVDLIADGPPLELAPLRTSGAGGLAQLALAVRTHPVRLVAELIVQGWGLEEEHYPPEVTDLMRHRGYEGPEWVADTPSLAIEDDPCPRRRVARRLLRRLLHKGKIGPQYHTAFDHLAHGVAPQDRAAAYAIGEALLRAGLLGEKPSVGQRHIYLRREALPQIHALIERGDTQDPGLAGEWTARQPGGRPTPRL